MKKQKVITSFLASIMVGIMLLGLIVSVWPNHAGAVTSSELKDQLKALQEQKDAITAQIRDLEAQQSEYQYAEVGEPMGHRTQGKKIARHRNKRWFR